MNASILTPLLLAIALPACLEGRESLNEPDADSTGSEVDIGASSDGVPSPVEPESGAQIISNFETSMVLPQSVARLEVAVPAELDGTLRYRWAVEQPVGSVSLFMPSDEDPSPSFEMNVAGDYTFYVEVFDVNAVPGRVLASASLFMRAVPGSDLHISLTWHTPGDPDESDTGGTASGSAGSDVDLHLLRTDRGKTWFDDDDDCYWQNPRPRWSSAAEPTASLDRDDTDGAGPENINATGLLPSTLSVGVRCRRRCPSASTTGTITATAHPSRPRASINMGSSSRSGPMSRSSMGTLHRISWEERVSAEPTRQRLITRGMRVLRRRP